MGQKKEVLTNICAVHLSGVINCLCTTRCRAPWSVHMSMSILQMVFVISPDTVFFLIRSCKSLGAKWAFFQSLLFFFYSQSQRPFSQDYSGFFSPTLFRKCLLTVLCGAKWEAQRKTMLRLIILYQLRPPCMPVKPQGKLYPAPTQDPNWFSKDVISRLWK